MTTIIEQFELTQDTALMHTSSEGSTFKVRIPLLEAIRAHQKYVPDEPYTHACTNDDGTVLLTLVDNNLHLVTAGTEELA